MHSHEKLQSFPFDSQKPLFSPRTTWSNHLQQINSLTVNMTINIDKYILGMTVLIISGNLKTQFQKREKKIDILEFVYFSTKFLKEWNLELYGREVKMKECLIDLWKQIDIQNKGKITWQQFSSKIIEISQNLKSLSNNAGLHAPSFRQLATQMHSSKYQNPISKLIYLNKKNKMAFFREQSIQLQFFSTQPHPKQTSSFTQIKPLVLPQQELKVQTMVKLKEKNQQSFGEKATKNQSKTVKKEMKVSSYRNTVLDAIYLDDEKYDMLVVSCSDKYVRGYNVTNIIPLLAHQPENEDESMIHQFPEEMYNMAWDPINQVLYATGKNPKIYQWLVKVDSQREMDDPKGHDNMISTMLMMPKLQLLATGGYDGKLILWDTVTQSLKSRYEEHTRAVSSIAFHQGLVLLFTSGFDHKICVWNPYINSLIHKIDHSFNIVQLQIIPNTSYLLSLDVEGNIKIREINRFTQIATFCIFRFNQKENETFSQMKQGGGKEKQMNIIMSSKKDGNIHFYFATDKVFGFQYFEVEKNSINKMGINFTQIKYYTKKFKLMTPFRNHLVLWNLLAGRYEETFYDVADNDITAMEVVEDLNFFIVGDVDGNVFQRRISNGLLIKHLIKMKASINKIKFSQMQRNQKQRNKKTYLLFITTEQGQVGIMKCHPKTQLVSYRHFSLKNDFHLTNGNIISLQYFAQKNILILSLTNNEVIVIDIQKKSLLDQIQLEDNPVCSMNIIVGPQNDQLLTVLTKNAQVSGFYLPPHPKKFKPCWNFNCSNKQIKIQCSAFGPKTNTYFLFTESNRLQCHKLTKKHLQNQNNTTGIEAVWKKKLQKKAIQMLLIQDQKVLILLNQSQDFTFVSTDTGKIICSLKQEVNQQTPKQQINPILFYNQNKSKIRIPNLYEPIDISVTQQQSQIEQIINPNFYIQQIQQRGLNDFNKISNQSWGLYLDFTQIVNDKIKQIKQIDQKIKNQQKNFDKKPTLQLQKKIQEALELQKRWEKQKDKEIQVTNNFVKNYNTIERSASKAELSSHETKKKYTRGSSLIQLWKSRQSFKKSQFPLHPEKLAHLNQKDLLIQKIRKGNQFEQNIDATIQNTPLYRLGLALKNLDNKDKKAENFMQLARKKEQIKFPKLNSQKMKI